MNIILNDEQVFEAIRAVSNRTVRKRLLKHFYNGEDNKDEYAPKCIKCINYSPDVGCLLYYYDRAVQCLHHNRNMWRTIVSTNSNVGKMFSDNNVQLKDYQDYKRI